FVRSRISFSAASIFSCPEGSPLTFEGLAWAAGDGAATDSWQGTDPEIRPQARGTRKTDADRVFMALAPAGTVKSSRGSSSRDFRAELPGREKDRRTP